MRQGFTLVELLIVTMVVGILAAVAAPSLRAARERAFVAATKAEVRHAAQHVELYLSFNHQWPTRVEDLAEVGYTPSSDIVFCRFNYVAAGGEKGGGVGGGRGQGQGQGQGQGRGLDLAPGRNRANGVTEQHVALEAVHKASQTAVRTAYPIDGGAVEEVPRSSSACTTGNGASG
jgi:prepilin-type N-terminal cleavage/methylation domain-containing protein